jgi:predicted ATP-dependent endonuclease of OLD family
MKEIGFRNFRRFQEMKSLPLGGINLFVGGNNAGKSTVVKGLLLLLDFLKNQKISSSNLLETPKFRFDGPGAHDVNIDTFNRALCWNSKEKEISFCACIEDFEVEVCIYNDAPKDEVGYASVKSIKLEDEKTGLKFMFDVAKGKAIVSLYFSDKQKEILKEQIEKQEKELEQLVSEINKINGLIPSEEDSKKLFDLIEKRSFVESVLAIYKNTLNSADKEAVKIQLQQSLSSNYSYIFSYLQGLVEFVEISGSSKNNKSGKTELSRQELAWLEQHVMDIRDVNARFDHAVQKLSIEYLYSHDANQQVIYNKKDENDYVSKSIYEFYNQRISSESETGKKMLSWLKEFCDIDDYKVEPVQGVAYRFTIKSGDKWVDLADMGRGTIQLVILFVRLASIIKKYQGKTDAPIVLVEEPEQNLHPAYQSDLLDVFYEIFQDYGIRFILETHSEYLVRNLQLKVASILNNKDSNVSLDEANSQYIVYYFPQQGDPYSMVFLKNGRFENVFDAGFYDKAGSLNIQLVKAGKGE